MSDKIRWGVLSTAKIGKEEVIPAMQKAKNGEVVAVASRNLEKARAFAKELGLPKAYGSYEELIADPEIDAIYNPLPNSDHAPWSIKCAEGGKAVLCEKPFASNAPEAQHMVDVFAQRNILLAEAFMWRFHPQTMRAKQMVDSGEIGEMRMIQSAFTFAISSEKNIRLSKPLAGGSVMDVGCYCINVMRLMTGEEPVKAEAFGHIGTQSQVEETLTGILTFPSGVLGHFHSSLRLEHNQNYEIHGTKGRLRVENAFRMPYDKTTVIRCWRGGNYEEISIPPANEYTLMAEDFADALLNKRPPRFLPQDGVANMRVIDMLYAAMGK